MSFPRDTYPYTNFHELNLGYFIVHFREIFSQWADLYDRMLNWKDATDEELATWKAGVEADLDQREAALRAELETWKAQTGQDIAGWEDATLAALTSWQTATQAVFEAIRVEAAGSASAAAASAGDAATAKTAAETAQAAAEAAAASVQASAAQIQQNTDDIDELKTQLNYAITLAADGGYGTLDLTRKTNVNRIINGSHNWAATSGSITACIYSVPPGIRTFKILGKEGGYFAFLQSIDNMGTVGSTPDFCTGYAHRISEPTDVPAEYIVDNCLYIWAYLTNSSGADVSLTSIECDSNIVNDAELAGTVEKINTRFLEGIQLPDTDLVSGIIQDSGKWATTSPAKGWMIPSSAATLCRIKAGTNNAIIAFLRSDTIVSREEADFSMYSKSRIVITAGTTETYIIPTDASYIYIAQKSTSGTDLTPEKTEFDVWTPSTDKTLSVPDKAADAKAVGDALDDVRADIVDRTKPLMFYGADHQSWTRQLVSYTGAITSNTNNILSDFIDARNFNAVEYVGPGTIDNAAVVAHVCEYTDNNSDAFHKRTTVYSDNTHASARLSPVTKYVRVIIGHPSAAGTAMPLTNSVYALFSLYAENRAYYIDNALKKAEQLRSVPWTALGNVYKKDGSVMKSAGQDCNGIPYSSAKEYDKFVGFNVSLRTFMTAAHNKYSLLYTENINKDVNLSEYGIEYHGTNCGSYFGNVCSSFVGFALGMKEDWETAFVIGWLVRNGDMTVVPDQTADGVQICDAIWTPGHIIMVYDIIRGVDGNVEYVMVTETQATFPLKRRVSKSDFNEMIADGAVILRYTKLYENTSYSASPFIAVGDDTLPVGYTYNSDICTFAGDYAAFHSGEEIWLNYNLNDAESFAYTGYAVYKDGGATAVATGTLPTGHKVSLGAALAPGLYTAVLTGTGDNSEPTHFEVIETDVSLTVADGIVTVSFSSVNGAPNHFKICELDGTDLGMRVLTEEEKMYGEFKFDPVKLNAVTGQAPALTTGNIYLKVYFKGRYGCVANTIEAVPYVPAP